MFSLPGNGYIEGTELDGFLREFVSSVNVMDVGPEVRTRRRLFPFMGTKLETTRVWGYAEGKLLASNNRLSLLPEEFLRGRWSGNVLAH